MSSFSLPYETRPRVCLHFYDESLTKQSFKDECDINNILRKYKKNMGLDFLNQFSGVLEGQFGDVSVVPSYQDALAHIAQANELFDAMPADLRYKFNNDPGNFLEFMSDSRNLDEAKKLGLLKPEVELKSTIPDAPAG